MRNTLRVGLFGGFGDGNTGNDATAAVTVEHLRAALPEVDLRLITSAEDLRPVAEAFDLEVVTLHRERSTWTVAGIGRFVSRPWSAARDLVRTWAVARSVDVVVVVGGGIFESEAASGPQGWVAMAGLFVLSVASSIGRHSLAFVGVGGTYLPTFAERRLLAASMRRAEYRSFRDQGSLQAVVRMGGAGPQDHVTADLVFAAGRQIEPLERVDSPESAEDGWSPGEAPHETAHGDELSLAAPIPCAPVDGALRADAGPTEPGDGPRMHARVALGVMGFSWITRDEPGGCGSDPYVQALAGAAAQLAEQGDEVVVFCGDTADLHVVHRVVELAHDRLDHVRADLVTVLTSVVFAEHLRELALTDVVVCSRFHNTVAALLLEKATVAVADRIKVRDLMGRVGLQEYMLEARGLTADALVQRVRQAQKCSGAITLALAPLVATAREQATAELDELTHLISRWSGLAEVPPSRPVLDGQGPDPITACEDVVSPS